MLLPKAHFYLKRTRCSIFWAIYLLNDKQMTAHIKQLIISQYLGSFKVHRSQILLHKTQYPPRMKKKKQLKSFQNPDMNNSQPSAMDQRAETDLENQEVQLLCLL